MYDLFDERFIMKHDVFSLKNFVSLLIRQPPCLLISTDDLNCSIHRQMATVNDHSSDLNDQTGVVQQQGGSDNASSILQAPFNLPEFMNNLQTNIVSMVNSAIDKRMRPFEEV